MTRPLVRVADAVDAFQDRVGRLVSWLTLGIVLVCFATVVLRYGFNGGAIWMQEAYVWQHGLVFMLGAGYALKQGDHVRVDLLYGRLSRRRRAWIDIAGTLLFLMPWLLVIAWYSTPFIQQSWAVREASNQAGGLPGYFLLKGSIWLFCLLLGLQAVALMCRRVAFLAGDDSQMPMTGGH